MTDQKINELILILTESPPEIRVDWIEEHSREMDDHFDMHPGTFDEYARYWRFLSYQMDFCGFYVLSLLGVKHPLMNCAICPEKAREEIKAQYELKAKHPNLDLA